MDRAIASIRVIERNLISAESESLEKVRLIEKDEDCHFQAAGGAIFKVSTRGYDDSAFPGFSRLDEIMLVAK